MPDTAFAANSLKLLFHGSALAWLWLMPFLLSLFSVRGWPRKIHSDQGSQLRGAASELSNAVKNLDWSEIVQYGHEHGTLWKFSPADSQWHNGSTEALVKTTKRALAVVLKDHPCTYSEFQTIMFEVAQIVNQRPIGRKPTTPFEAAYLCPNDLLLGRSTASIPQGPFEDEMNTKDRYKFTQAFLNSFWRRWMTEIFPSLVVEQKWHVERRNVSVGDVVLFQECNTIRGEWKMAIVTQVKESSVRNDMKKKGNQKDI